ncbi:MAG: hypothetical protein ABEJ23_09440 [Haloarculaceae archaeon]
MADVASTSGPAPTGRSLRAGGAVVLLSSIVVSALSFGALPVRVRVHWTFGSGPYYGPEFVGRAVVPILFPLLVAVLFAGTTWLAARLERAGAFGSARSVYDAIVLATLAVLVLAQIALVAANLG